MSASKKKIEKPQLTLAEARQQLYNALSLCRKAGKLILGYDASVESAVAKKASHLFTAADASKSTVSRAQFETEGLADVKPLPLTQQELLGISRKSVAVYAVSDANLARLCEMKRKQCEDLMTKEEVSE